MKSKEAFYGHTSQHQAVIVRSDGSATAQYPTEGVAVSVDPDQTGQSSFRNAATTSFGPSTFLGKYRRPVLCAESFKPGCRPSAAQLVISQESCMRGFDSVSSWVTDNSAMRESSTKLVRGGREAA